VEYPAVVTVARKGTAVVFHHNRPDMTPEIDAWHAGCLPISGDKWTLQKFKGNSVIMLNLHALCSLMETLLELPDKYRKAL
jgi:hypothetical protein